MAPVRERARARAAGVEAPNRVISPAVGFDWPDLSGAMDKLSEEAEELREAVDGRGDPAEELGDLLFAVVNVARHLKVDPERAMEKTCNKFVRRFAEMERQARQENKALSDLSLTELDTLWNRSKEKE